MRAVPEKRIFAAPPQSVDLVCTVWQAAPTNPFGLAPLAASEFRYSQTDSLVFLSSSAISSAANINKRIVKRGRDGKPRPRFAVLMGDFKGCGQTQLIERFDGCKRF